MMVVLSIITVITIVALVGHSNFDRSLLITDAAYSMALSMREMQTYGISARVVQGTSLHNAGYGVSFLNTAPTSYEAFADTNETGTAAYCPPGESGTPDEKTGNCIYTSGSDTSLQTYRFARGFSIVNFCGKEVGGTRRCSSDNYITSLDIVFRRPDTDAIINAKRSTGAWIQLTSAEIQIATPDRSAVRSVCVSTVGQISVSSSACP